MTPLLTLTNIAKTYDNGVEAIARLDMSVAQGEFVSLVGPSGCGKSTALRIIAGLLHPERGAVEFPSGRPQIGFVFQEATLMPWATVAKNARLPLDLKGVSRKEAEARSLAALERVGLSGFESAYPRELSGGMKMRVSIARALAAKPTLLLMDEPFAALDEFTRQSLNDDLLKLVREDGITVIFVTHSVYESAYLSDRVVVMTPRPGRVAADIAITHPAERGEHYRLTDSFGESVRRITGALQTAMAPA